MSACGGRRRRRRAMRDEGDDKGLPDNGDRFTVAEMHDSIEALSDPDVAKLVAASRAFCRLCGIPPDDLLQEAYTRALEGRRTCHRGTGIVEFLCGVMKSLASQENEARKEGIERARALFAKAKQEILRQQLLKAKAESNAWKSTRTKDLVSFDRTAARVRFDKIRSGDTEFDRKMTIAARSGEAPTDADI